MKGKIFNAQEVQAIISGSKTQFREVIKPQPNNYDGRTAIALSVDGSGQLLWQDDDSGWFKDYDDVKCPYQVGQKIFCKESFWQFGGYDGGSDGDEARFIGSNKITFCPEEAAKPQTLYKGWKKRPAQHMKQEHSRLTLLIKEIRVERLASISEEDAIKEGCKAEYWLTNTPDCYEHDGITATEDFAALWDETHKKPEEKLEANPWVWVVRFEIVNQI